MTEPNPTKDFKFRLKALCPLVDTIRLILTAARHAFNRHSRAQLEEMAKLQKEFTLKIDPFFESVETGLKQGPTADQPDLQNLQKILTHLELMAYTAAGLAEQLRYKANHGAILSEQDIFAVNRLFTRLNGLLQALVDIFQIHDPALKAYLLQECKGIREDWFNSETDHETRMMDSPGQASAWSVYLAILEASRTIVHHLEDIIKILF
ncbi:MAG: hypothetical protein ACUVXF_12310 [Desulfobaccales bacterium]